MGEEILSLLPYLLQFYSAWTTNKQNQQNFERSLTWQEEQTKNAQDYNSIGEQMMRAKAAGVNPLAILSGQYSPTPVGAAIAPSLPTLQNPLGGAGDMLNALADYRNKLADTDLKKAQANTENATRAAQIQVMTSQAEMNRQYAKESGYSSELQSKQLEWFDMEMSAKIENYDSQTFVNNEQAANIKRQTDELVASWDERYRTFFLENAERFMHCQEMEATIQKYASEVDLNIALGGMYAIQTEGYGFENAEKQARARIAEDLTAEYYRSLKNANDIAEQEAKLKGKEAKYVGLRAITGSIKDVAIGVAAVATAVKPVPSIDITAPKVKNSQTIDIGAKPKNPFNFDPYGTNWNPNK